MTEALFLLYALTVSLELVLSLLMAAFLYLILAPGNRGRQVQAHAAPLVVSQHAAGAAPAAVPVDPTQLAIRRAIETIARGENDMQVLIQTRRVLQQAEQAARASGPHDASDAPS